MYANICFVLAIICFVVDGFGLCQNLHLLSWGSALFTAGFITWEVRQGHDGADKTKDK